MIVTVFLIIALYSLNAFAQKWQLMPGTKSFNNAFNISALSNDSLIVCSNAPFIGANKDIVLNSGSGFVGIGKTTSPSSAAGFMKRVRGRNLLFGAHWGIVGCSNGGTGLGNDCGLIVEFKNNNWLPLYSLSTDTIYLGYVREIIEYDNKIFVANNSCPNQLNLVYLDDSLNFIPIEDTLRDDVKALEIFKDTLFIAGSFWTNWQNAPADFFAYLDKSDYRVKPYGNSLNSKIFDIKVYNNEMYAVGWFNATSTDSLYGAAKLDSVTHQWKNIATKGLTTGGGFGQMLVFNNKLFMCGEGVTTIDTIKNCNNLVAWDGTKFKSYGLPGWKQILSMCIFKDKLTVTGYDSTGYSFIYQLVSDTGALGVIDNIKEINNVNNLQVNVFPNPSDGNITLNCSLNEKVSYQIFDITGKLVKEGSFKENTKFSTDTFAKGTYKVVVKNKGGSLTKSLIVQ